MEGLVVAEVAMDGELVVLVIKVLLRHLEVGIKVLGAVEVLLLMVPHLMDNQDQAVGHDGS